MATLTASSTMLIGQMTTLTDIVTIPKYANSTMLYGQMTTDTKVVVPFQASVYKNGNWL